jgi:hypothetical protein
VVRRDNANSRSRESGSEPEEAPGFREIAETAKRREARTIRE